MTREKTKITVRRWRQEDIPGIIECSIKAYPDYSEEYIFTPRHYEMQFAAFPNGQFVALIGDKIVGYATSVVVNIEDDFWYNVDEIQVQEPSAPIIPTAIPCMGPTSQWTLNTARGE